MTMLRIIGGSFKGKKIEHSFENITRPTSTRTREALFNCLYSLDFSVHNLRVMDGFSGTGAVGLEFLSRGAEHVIFVDNHPQALKIIQKNRYLCKVEGQSSLYNSFSSLPMVRIPLDIVFLDPPYTLIIDEKKASLWAIQQLILKGYIQSNTLIIIEGSSDDDNILSFEGNHHLEVLKEKQYGAAKLLFITYSEKN